MRFLFCIEYGCLKEHPYPPRPLSAASSLKNVKMVKNYFSARRCPNFFSSGYGERTKVCTVCLYVYSCRSQVQLAMWESLLPPWHDFVAHSRGVKSDVALFLSRTRIVESVVVAVEFSSFIRSRCNRRNRRVECYHYQHSSRHCQNCARSKNIVKTKLRQNIARSRDAFSRVILHLQKEKVLCLSIN